VEIMQHKGDSECLPGAGAADELCGFEKLRSDSFAGRYAPFLAEEPRPRQFVRHALTEGLRQQELVGVNPFQYGIIASTDTHLGTPGLVAESADYPGHGGAGPPAGDALPVGLPDAIDFNPGGLAVLFAEENTREALFRAMRRREAYATSGPRIGVRFFGSWKLPAETCAADDLAREGYARGVPMGGELPARPEGGGAPTFVLAATRDPGAPGAPGTPLQRAQVVKGWVDAEGGLRQRVFEVAGTPDDGAGVDLATCEPEGAGHDALCGIWRDPAFDPAHPAFYYARVVENPTCRWSQKACNAAGVRCGDGGHVPEGYEECCAPDIDPVIQERAWTSPIWYVPEG
jgi:hypothetical protein